MVTHLQRVVSSLERHLKLRHTWIVLRIQGIQVKKHGTLLVIEGNLRQRPIRNRLKTKTIAKRKQKLLASPKASSEINHELLLYTRTPPL